MLSTLVIFSVPSARLSLQGEFINSFGFVASSLILECFKVYMSIIKFYNAAITCCDKHGQICICGLQTLLRLNLALVHIVHIQKVAFCVLIINLRTISSATCVM